MTKAEWTDMSCCVIWEFKFPPEEAKAGRTVTEAIWRDMRDFDGYLAHELLVDADDQGYLLLVSRWASREHADASLRQYANHPNVQTVNRLVAEPRRRIVMTSLGGFEVARDA